MNIVLLVSEYPPTTWGLANYSYNIAKYLSLNNHVNVYVLPSTSSVVRYAENIKFVAGVMRKLREKRDRREVDVVYAITFQPQFSIIGLFARLLGLPFVSHGVGLDVYISSPFGVFARKMAYLLSNGIICGARFQKRILEEEGARKEKIFVVLGGVDCEIFKPLAQRDELRKTLGVEDNFVLLALGRLSKRKGFDDAIKALTYLKDIDDLVLLIVGEGPERRNLEELARSLFLESRVKFLGFVSSDYLPGIYNIADLFIAPFKTIGRDIEGFPLVVQEAQACRVPVISTFSAGLPDLVENRTSGFLVHENLPREIATKICKLYNDSDLRKKMGLNARKKTETLLNWKVAVHKIENILRNARE